MEYLKASTSPIPYSSEGWFRAYPVITHTHNI